MLTDVSDNIIINTKILTKEGEKLAAKKGVIADTIHGNIELTNFEKKIMSHVMFNRLHDVYQNSTVYLTFPCNRTKRFEHSLGTMKLCGDMFSSAVSNSESEMVAEFLGYYNKELKNIIEDVKNNKYKEYESALGGRIKKIDSDNIPKIEEMDVSFIPSSKDSDKYYTTYFILIQAIRVSALLHDIGHPPYSHITEFALENVRNSYKDSNENERIIEFNKIMDSFFGQDGKKLHEQMGDKIVGIILEDSIDKISEHQANKNRELFNTQVVHILVKETVQRILLNQKPFDALHRIIDGTLDGDRLDYVTRDAVNSGLDRGHIEYERLCNGMVIAKYNDEYWICPSIKSLNTVEDFLNRRWDIYKNIIFHHRVIKTDYLLQSVIEKISEDYLNKAYENEQRNDSSDLLPADISGLWKALKSSTNVESSYAISQWDDSWLMTVLKRHYFKDYIEGDREEKVKKQLEELLTNKKYYFSAIKRLEDFLVVDNAISEQLNVHSTELGNKISELRKISGSYDKNESEIISIDPFLSGVEMILNLSKSIEKNQAFQGLIFSLLKKLYKVVYDDNVAIEEFLEGIVQNAKGELPEGSVDDVFVVMKNYDIGIKKALLLYNNKQKKVVSIHEVSSIANVLELGYDTFPQFYIYILKSDNYNGKINTEVLLKKIGKDISDKFYNRWVAKLDDYILAYKS